MISGVFTEVVTGFAPDTFRLNGRSGLIPFIRKASVQYSTCLANSGQDNGSISCGNDSGTN